MESGKWKVEIGWISITAPATGTGHEAFRLNQTPTQDRQAPMHSLPLESAGWWSFPTRSGCSRGSEARGGLNESWWGAGILLLLLCKYLGIPMNTFRIPHTTTQIS